MICGSHIELWELQKHMVIQYVPCIRHLKNNKFDQEVNALIYRIRDVTLLPTPTLLRILSWSGPGSSPRYTTIFSFHQNIKFYDLFMYHMLHNTFQCMTTEFIQTTSPWLLEFPRTLYTYSCWAHTCGLISFEVALEKTPPLCLDKCTGIFGDWVLHWSWLLVVLLIECSNIV